MPTEVSCPSHSWCRHRKVPTCKHLWDPGASHSLQEQQARRAGWVSAPGMMLWWWWAELKDKYHTSSPLKQDNCETGSTPSPQGLRRCLFISIPFLGFLPAPSHSVQLSRSVVSSSLWAHELQHARPPCPSPAPESTQTHVRWLGDAIQPSHPLSSPSSPAFNLSQHQGLFKWVSSSHQVAKVLEFQFQHQSYQWTPRTDLL